MLKVKKSATLTFFVILNLFRNHNKTNLRQELFSHLFAVIIIIITDRSLGTIDSHLLKGYSRLPK